MSNLTYNLALPALNGAGAATDTSLMGGDKSVIVTGTFPGCTITVEISQTAGGAGAYAPVYTFQSTGDATRVPINVAARYMRVTVGGRVAGGAFAAVAEVSASDIGASFAALNLPAANGNGVALDVSAMGGRKTVVIGGAFAGKTITIQASDDGATYSPVMAFSDVGGQQTVDLTCAWLRATVAGAAGALTATAGVGAVNDPISISLGGASNCLVFQPGGTGTGPVVYSSWATLYAALDAKRTAAGGGCYTIEFDDSITTPAVVPVGASAWDMTGVSWEGAKNGAAVSLADGVSFTALRRFFNLTITSLAAGASPSPIADVADGAQFFLRKTSLVGPSSTVPMIRLDAAGTARLWMNEGSTLIAAGGASNGWVISAFGGVAIHLQVTMDASSSIPRVAALGQGGAGDLLIEAPDGIQVPILGGLWTLAANSPIIEGPANLRPNPYLGAASTVAVTLLHGEWARLNAQSGVGAISQPLPSINAATGGLKAAGVMVAVSNDAAADSIVTLTPAGGDTIEALASYTVHAGGCVMLISDGVSNWTVAGVFPARAGTYVDVTDVTAQPVAGVPIIIGVTLADAAGANYTITVTGKFEILDAWLIKNGAGAGNTTKLVNVDAGANDITDLMAAAVDKAVTRVGTLDPAQQTITSGAFRVTTTRAAGSAAQKIYVLGVFRP